jgi:hypothetical protein
MKWNGRAGLALPQADMAALLAEHLPAFGLEPFDDFMTVHAPKIDQK